MVQVLIDLRTTITRNQLARGSTAAIWAAVAFGILSAAGTLTLGIEHGHQVDGSLDRISAVLVLWFGGQLAQSALSGGEVALRPELLALLPLNRRRLAAALLVVGLCDPVLVIVAIAYAAVIAIATGLGTATALLAVIGALGLLVLTSVATTVVGGLLGPGSRRGGRDLGTLILALAISCLALASTLLPTLLSRLQSGRWQGLAIAVRVLPTGWPGDAVAAAYHGDWALTTVALAGPFIAAAAVAACWPAVLTRRMSLSAAGTRRIGRHVTRLLAPHTPTTAVAVKELRLWLRDPMRVTCLLIALAVGIGIGLVPRLTTHDPQLLAFGGPLTVLIAGACASDLYAGDGTSLWLTIAAPNTSRADVRGRQLAWLLLVAPLATAETVILTLWASQSNLWPWALGLLVALIGGCAGLIPLASLIGVQPRDEAGNPTPGWSLKVHIALIVFAATAAPAVALLALGTLDHNAALSWLGVGVAALIALAATSLLGAAAARRLQTRQIDILKSLTG